jgi:selenocysteine lyase/cysteine desulfurase
MALSRRAFLRGASVAAGAALGPQPVLAQITGKTATPASLQDWAAVRRLFDLTAGRVHAALFFLASNPRPVRVVMEEMRRRLDANPLDTVEQGALVPSDKNRSERSRAAIARYIGARPDEVAFANSTTHGLAVAYHGLSLRAGDEVLASEHDHFSHLDTIRLVAERTGASMRRVRLFEPHDASAATAEGVVKTFIDAISPATRVLGVTWVHSSSGLKVPLAALATALREVNARRDPERRVLMVVDGVHGLGADELKPAESGVDVFVAGLHKWMLAPRGTGIVWARADTWARMRPLVVSYESIDLYDAWMAGKPAPSLPRASWFGLGGFQAYEHIWAVAAAVELHEAIGRARVAQRIRELNTHAREELSKMAHVRVRTPKDPALCGGITAFDVEGMDGEAAVNKLHERSVLAAASPYRPTYARLSFGIANSEEDVETALNAVRALAAR